MLDTFTREITARWGLGDQGRPLVQMLVAHISNPATGGLAGFLEKFRKAGWGGMVNTWVEKSRTAEAPTTAQVDAVLGTSNGFLQNASTKLGLSYDKVIAAVAGVLPQLVGQMTPDGNIPTALPAEFGAFAREGQALLAAGMGVGAGAAAYGAAHATAHTTAHSAPAAAASPLPSSSGSLGKWLPWLMGALAVILGLSYCNQRTDPVTTTAPAAPVSTAPEQSPAPAPMALEPVAPVVPEAPAVTGDTLHTAAPLGDNFTAPEGAGVVDDMHNGMPVVRVFFDTGKTDVDAAFAQQSKALVDFLNANPDAKAVISGFNDPTGDAARNAELSKERAQAVKAALEAAGVAADRAVLEKPAETAATGDTNAASRRVDVVLRR